VDGWQQDLFSSLTQQPFAEKLLHEKPSKIIKLTDTQIEIEVCNFIIQFLNHKISTSQQIKKSDFQKVDMEELFKLFGTSAVSFVVGRYSNL
jgi:hypothetical protein